MRILVASNDPPFRRVTHFLLARRGFAVAEARSSDVVEAVGSRGHQVVVLDGEDSLPEAARLAALLEEFHPGLAVMLVGGDGEIAGDRARFVFHKWESFEALVEAIEDLRVPARRA